MNARAVKKKSFAFFFLLFCPALSWSMTLVMWARTLLFSLAKNLREICTAFLWSCSTHMKQNKKIPKINCIYVDKREKAELIVKSVKQKEKKKKPKVSQNGIKK